MSKQLSMFSSLSETAPATVDTEAIAAAGQRRNVDYDPNREKPGWALPIQTETTTKDTLPQSVAERVAPLSTRTEDEGSRGDFTDNTGGTFNMMAVPADEEVALRGLALAQSVSKEVKAKHG